MNPLFTAALEIQAFCTERLWGFCVIGGLAVELALSDGTVHSFHVTFKK